MLLITNFNSYYLKLKILNNPTIFLVSMYVLAEMRDIVHVKPWQFDQDLRIVVEDELNKKYANKVIYELGLCIALFDISKIEDSYVFPGDGSSHTRVTFRYVVFRPFIDEVLVGNILLIFLNLAF